MADEPAAEAVTDAEVVPDPPAAEGFIQPQDPHTFPPEPGTELQHVPQQPQAVATLYGTSDPAEIIERTANIATQLKKVLDEQNMTTPMGGGREHVDVEGWQTCGTLLGVQPMIVAVEKQEPSREFEVTSKRKKWGKVDGRRQVIEETENTWMAVGHSYRIWAECRTLDGRVVGKGVGFCSREESKWQDADEYAVIGMASTRAVSRAMRQALGFVIGMAGYATTPTEEMPADQHVDAGPPYGPPMPDDKMGKVQEAAAFLMDHGEGPDEVVGKQLIDKLIADAGDYLPDRVGRALLHAAVILREATDGGDG